MSRAGPTFFSRGLRQGLLLLLLGCLAAGPAVAEDAGPERETEATEADVDVTLKVQLVAQLKVVNASGAGTVSTSERGFVGDPSPAGPVENMAHIRLITDRCVGGVAFDFPRISGLRPGGGGWYGAATGRARGYTLGVQPFVRSAAGVRSFGSLSAMRGAGRDRPLMVGGRFCNGAHDFFVGMVPRWDLTLPGQPRFAPPDRYRIPVTATIVP